MVVFLMEKVSVSLRGEITRWMLELRPGVFVGNISALVREKLWETICQNRFWEIGATARKSVFISGSRLNFQNFTKGVTVSEHTKKSPTF